MLLFERCWSHSNENGGGHNGNGADSAAEPSSARMKSTCGSAAPSNGTAPSFEALAMLARQQQQGQKDQHSDIGRGDEAAIYHMGSTQSTNDTISRNDSSSSTTSSSTTATATEKRGSKKGSRRNPGSPKVKRHEAQTERNNQVPTSHDTATEVLLFFPLPNACMYPHSVKRTVVVDVGQKKKIKSCVTRLLPWEHRIGKQSPTSI